MLLSSYCYGSSFYSCQRRDNPVHYTCVAYFLCFLPSSIQKSFAFSVLNIAVTYNDWAYTDAHSRRYEARISECVQLGFMFISWRHNKQNSRDTGVSWLTVNKEGLRWDRSLLTTPPGGDSLTPRSIFLLEKLIVAQVHYHFHKVPLLVPILSQTNPVQTLPTISLRSILILSSNLCTDLHSGLIPSGFLSNILCRLHFSSPPCALHGLPISYHPNKIWWSVQVTKFIVKSSPRLPSLHSS
jgi:hypothetical protein